MEYVDEQESFAIILVQDWPMVQVILDKVGTRMVQGPTISPRHQMALLQRGRSWWMNKCCGWSVYSDRVGSEGPIVAEQWQLGKQQQ